MPILDLALPSSPPKGARRGDSGLVMNADHVGLMPIQLENGCCEADCSIESDNVCLTNAVRRHFLEHFGHRDLDGIVAGYDPDAILVSVVNGVRTSYHGHEEIRAAYQEIFQLHPTVNSTFELKHIVIHDSNAMVIWSAETPTHVFPQSSDNILFHEDGKISKHFFSCQRNEVEAK